MLCRDYIGFVACSILGILTITRTVSILYLINLILTCFIDAIVHIIVIHNTKMTNHCH